MEIDLQPVEEIDFTNSERAIFNVLKATLQYPANPQVKGLKLADDIDFFCKSAEGEGAVSAILWDVWGVMVEIVYRIPPGHPWQVSLVQSLDNPTYTGEDVGEEFTKWENLNSFVARLTKAGFAPWLNFPIWQLRMTLEEPPVKGPAMACRLRVAAEWVIHCADAIFEEMNSKEELDESLARALRTGPLYEGKPPLSIERWDFWKKRFSEIGGDLGNLEVDSAMSRQISDALRSIDAVGK
ncbi:hypothetical protein DIS24_g7919 [Lasiodiplodia hormozganensis]|uniref:Uncharacterized protein n=1 Tax=Lasiodiplodia hormozganensis TaxID=869390 RepID=A0AA39Y772_9PEZI|nr:hypothetical protein DIS24_g7919 [Lasiodiplodia hormozganensis]